MPKVVAEGCVNEALEQIVAADVILLNKTDLVEKPQRARIEA